MGGLCYLSIILLENSYLFKIIELEKKIKQKITTDLEILNKWEFFSGMIDK